MYILVLCFTAVYALEFEGQEHKRLVDEAFILFKEVVHTPSGLTLEALLKANNQGPAPGNRIEPNPDTSVERSFWTPFLSQARGKGKSEKSRQWYTSLGQITALAGDYYGPESFQELLDHDGVKHRNFLKVFTQFAEPDPFWTVRQWDFLNRIANEGTEINIAPSKYGNRKAPALQAVYDAIASKDTLVGTGGATLKHLADVAMYNTDHFEPSAGNVAEDLHILATRLIRRWSVGLEADLEPQVWNIASKITGDDITTGPNMNALNMALAVEAFSLHYTTDIFSAGHLRTPRDALSGAKSGCGAITAGFTVKVMHDEDSFHGVWVKDILGNSWHCKGDATLLATDDTQNLKRAHEAVKASLYSLLKAGGFNVDHIKFQWYIPRGAPALTTVQEAPPEVKSRIVKNCDQSLLLVKDITKNPMPCSIIFRPWPDYDKQLQSKQPNRCPRYYLDKSNILKVRQKCGGFSMFSKKSKEKFETEKKACCYREFSRAWKISIAPDDCCFKMPARDDGVFTCGANDDAEDIES